MKKLKANIDIELNERIQKDLVFFDIKKATLGNKLIRFYSDKILDNKKNNKKNSIAFQFNLSKETNDIFFEVMIQNKIVEDAEFLRRLLYTYISNPRFIRERILLLDYFEIIEKAIEDNKKIFVNYNNQFIVLSPFAIKIDELELQNYLFGFSDSEGKYCYLEMKKIRQIDILNEKVDNKDKIYVKKVMNSLNLDLAFGNKIILKTNNSCCERIQKEGDKPKIIEVINEDNQLKCIFECSNEYGYKFFSKYYSEVEILEPLILREKIKEEVNKMYKKYNKEEQI